MYFSSADSVQTSYRHIWKLSWPVMVSNMSLPLVGAVDVAMMGHLPDAAYVAGVALGGLIFNLVYLSFAFLRMGTTGFTARAAGAQQNDEISLIFIRSQLLAIAGSLIVILAAPLLIPLAAGWFASSPEAGIYMQAYLDIRLWGLPATLANAVTIGWLFGLQAMRLCMLQLVFINLLNVGLNFYFVLGMGMKIEGVALASAVAEWAGFGLILSIILLQPKRLPLKLGGQNHKQLFDKRRWRALFSIARDLSLRTLLLWGIEALLLARAGIYGDNQLAAIEIVLVLFGFIAFGLDGFAHATEALAGAAIGAGQRQQLITVIRRTTVLAGLTAAALSCILYLFEGLIILALTSQPELQRLVADLWLWCLFIPPASFLAFQMDGVFVGAGSAGHMRNGMLVSFALFAGLVYIFQGAGLDGLLWAFNLYLIFRGLYLFVFLSAVTALGSPPQPPQSGHQTK